MKVITTITVNHKIDGEERKGRVLVCRDSMTKDGDYFEFVKTFKMDKNCQDIANGSVGSPLFNSRGKLAGWEADK